MEHRSTSDLLRELQAITAELARRHGVGPPGGGPSDGGGAPPGGSTASGANPAGVHGGPPNTAWTGEPQHCEPLTPVDMSAGAGRRATEESLDTPIIGAILTGTPDLFDPTA